MQPGLFAKKVGMTRIFVDYESGINLPVTILKTEECQVAQIKTVSKDGYNAVQVSYFEQNLEKLNRPNVGHLKKVLRKEILEDLCFEGNSGFRLFGEFRVSEPEDFHLGQVIKADTFSVGQKVRVTGKSIGKGFTGNQKRHNFSRGPMTHGSKNHRLPGSIGAGSTPGRVYPGKKMAGQLGGGMVTLTNSVVLYVNSEDKILVLQGSVPGTKNTILKIQPQKYN
jgi:large subunit ribosomal protein L3